MHIIPQQHKMSIYERLKLHLTALVNLLALIAILLLVPLGLKISESTVPTTGWLAMAGTILLTLMIVVNFINSVKLIRMWKHSTNGGKQISTKP